MGRRISEQWRELTRQDQQRRDMVANISHDLRTPLTSLHGYLETLRLKDATLEADERRRYLDIALAQSRKVGRLAQELFELARLESGLVRLEPEVFSLPELMHDVAQKFELAAEARRQRLHGNPTGPAGGAGRPGPDRARADQSAGQRHPPHAAGRRHRAAAGAVAARPAGAGRRHWRRHSRLAARRSVHARLGAESWRATAAGWDW